MRSVACRSDWPALVNQLMETTAPQEDQDRPKTTPWDDPALPPGTAPPQPKWRLATSIAAYLIWVGFLVTMVILRLRDTPV